MAFGADTVTYGLYRDAGRTLPWGATVGVDTASGTGTGLAQNLTVYGRIPPQTTPQPASYSDTIIATVTY
jgi:spore coat protein U-like protein